MDYHAVRAKLVDLEEKYYPLEAECHRLLMQIVDARKMLRESGAIYHAVSFRAVASHLAGLEIQYYPLQSKANSLWDQIVQLHAQLRIAIGRITTDTTTPTATSNITNNTTNNHNHQEFRTTNNNNTTNKRNHQATSSTSSIEQVRRARVKVPRRVDSDDEDSYPEVLPDIIETIVPDADQLYCSKCDRELPSDMFSDVQRRKGQSGAGVAVCLQHAKTYARATERIEVHNSDNESEAEEVSDDEDEIERRDRKEARRRVVRGIATTRPRRNPLPRDKWTYE